ncbi:MAG: hypothetical protein ACM3U0_01300 [archaeon]
MIQEQLKVNNQNENLNISENYFNIVEYARNGVANRFYFFGPEYEVTHCEVSRDSYKSIYLHTDEIKKFYKKNRNLQGYSDPVASGRLILQTDTTSLIISLHILRSTVIRLQNEYGVSPEEMRYMFDGESNFYLSLPAELFGSFTPSEDLPLLHSALKSKLVGDFSYSYKTYNNNSMMPLLNTLISKTGLYAIELTSEEVLSGEINVQKLAKSARKVTHQKYVISPNEKLISLKGRTIDEIRRQKEFLSIIHGFEGRGGYIEICSIKGRDSYSKNFASIVPAIKYALDFSGQMNVYYRIATTKTKDTGSLANCYEMNVLFSDIDYGKDGHKKKSFYETKEDAINAIAKLKLPPTVITCSGHGYQLLWKLNSPVILEGDKKNRIRNLLSRINSITGGDENAEKLTQLFRMPYTLNIKDGGKVLSVIEKMQPELSYSLEELEKWALEEEEVRPAVKCPGKEIIYYSDNSLTPSPKIKLIKWEEVFENCSWLREIYRKASEECHLTHPERFSLATLLNKFEGGEELLIQVLSSCSDFNEEVTNYQIREIRDRGYRPPLCERLCPNGLCSEMRDFGMFSPIAFAYRRAA